MERWLGKYGELVYAVMRLVIGLLFACHGAQKLFGLFGGQSIPSSALMTAAGIIEFFGGTLIALGLWGGYAAFITSGQMATAYFLEHASRGFWPIANQGEPAVVYCFIFLLIASRDSGSFSVDALIRKSKSTT